MYLAGLASADEGALYRYHEDLAPLLRLEEERQWAALEGAARTVAPGTDPDLLSRLKSLFGDQRVLELSFQESARPGADGVLQVERTITPSLEPGRYTLQVTVERPSSGEFATMRTSILLLQKSGG
jgi:hypothetical protein